MVVGDLPTPFLTLDLDAVERNIARWQAYCDAHGLALRAHVKTHKLPRIAGMQVDAGAVGIACQKLGEAEVMADAGIADILIPFPLVGPDKVERAAALASQVHLSVAGDSAVAARALAQATEARGVTIGWLVDCDTGFGRTGVQSPAEAAELAGVAAGLYGLELRGLMTHPVTPASEAWLREARERIEALGLTVEVVSGGGTPGSFHAHENAEVTELRVGNYVYGDRRCLVSGTHDLADCALRAVATVVSRPTSDRAILDAGTKTLTSDPALGRDDGLFGLVVEYPDAAVRSLSEEHAIVDLSASTARPELGEKVTVLPNHACGAANLHDTVAVHRSGCEVELVQVAARGLVR